MTTLRNGATPYLIVQLSSTTSIRTALDNIIAQAQDLSGLHDFSGYRWGSVCASVLTSDHEWYG